MKKKTASTAGLCLAVVAIASLWPEAGAGFKRFRREINPQRAVVAPAVAQPLNVSLLAPGSTDMSTVGGGQSFFTAYASEMTGTWFGLLGDGTQPTSSGVVLSPIGSPTTQNLSLCPNGPTCATVTAQRLDGSTQEFESTTGLAVPAGNFTVCLQMSIDDTAHTPAAQRQVFTKDVSGSRAFALKVDSNSIPTLEIGGVDACISSLSITPRASQFLCMAYTRVGAGTSTAQIYVDGVAATACTTVGLVSTAATAAKWEIGARNYVTSRGFTPGAVRLAFMTEKVLSGATVLAMAKTLNGTLIPSTGQAMTFVGNSPRTCLDTTGAGFSILPPLRPCVTQSGYSPAPTATNSALYSSDLSNAAYTKTSMTCVGDGIPAPDGATANSASKCTATGANGTAIQTVTIASALRATSVYLRRRTGTGTVNLTRDNGSTWIDVTADVSATWKRITPALYAGLSTTAANPKIGLRLVTSGDEVDVAAFQDEAGAVASPPIETAAVAVVRLVTYASMAVTGLSDSAGCMSVSAFNDNTGSSVGKLLAIGSGPTSSMLRSSDTAWSFNDGTNTVTATAASTTVGRFVPYIATWSGSTATMSTDGVLASGSYDGTAVTTTLYLGNNNGNGVFGGILKNIYVGVDTIGCAQ